jgi:hypothetical protein
MMEANTSIDESSSDAQTLIEPVRKPVAVLSKIKKAAMPMERRAADDFTAESSA